MLLLMAPCQPRRGERPVTEQSWEPVFAGSRCWTHLAPAGGLAQALELCLELGHGQLCRRQIGGRLRRAVALEHLRREHMSSP
jgi:hypothetical protein